MKQPNWRRGVGFIDREVDAHSTPLNCIDRIQAESSGVGKKTCNTDHRHRNSQFFHSKLLEGRKVHFPSQP